jgi:hypothetical protein
VAAVAAMTIVVAAAATVAATAVTDTKRLFLKKIGTFHGNACALKVLNR